MPEDVTLSVDHRLLEWIRRRVAETTEKGSIYMSIENGRLTWINYEKNSRFHPQPESSSGGPRSYDVSRN